MKGLGWGSGGRRTEDGGGRTEDGGGRTEEGKRAYGPMSECTRTHTCVPPRLLRARQPPSGGVVTVSPTEGTFGVTTYVVTASGFQYVARSMGRIGETLCSRDGLG